MASPFLQQGALNEGEAATERPIAEWLQHVEWSLEKVPTLRKNGERYAYTDELAKIYKLLAKMRGVLAEVPASVADGLAQAFSRHDVPVLNLLEMTEKPCPPLRVYGYRTGAATDAADRLKALVAATDVLGIDAVVARLCKMEALLLDGGAGGGAAALANVRHDLVAVMNEELKRSLAKMKTVNEEAYCSCIYCRIRRNIAGVDCSRPVGHDLSDDEVSLGETDPDMPDLSSGGVTDDEAADAADDINFNGVAMSVSKAVAAMDASGAVEGGGCSCCDGMITVIQPETSRAKAVTDAETEADLALMKMLADGHLMAPLKRQLKKKDLDGETKELVNKMIIEAKRLMNVLILGDD